MTPMWSADCHRLVIAIHGCGVDLERSVLACCCVYRGNGEVGSVDSGSSRVHDYFVETGCSIEADDGLVQIGVFEPDLLTIELADISALDDR